MHRDNFEKWSPFPTVAPMYYFDNISHNNGLEITLTKAQGFTENGSSEKIVMHFEHYQSYLNIDENYSDNFWIKEKENAWTFFRSEKSAYIDYLKNNSQLFADCIKKPVHYVFVTCDTVFHVVSDIEPKASIFCSCNR